MKEIRASTRSDAFGAQKSSILDMIRRRGPMSRRDAAKALGLRASSVSFHVSELLERGVLDEIGEKRADLGRPAILLSFRAGSRLSIGVLVEPRIMKGVVADLNGQVLRTEEAALSSDPEGREVVEKATSLVASLLEGFEKERFLGVGVAVPGFVDSRSGLWQEYGLMPKCGNTSLASPLSESSGLSVFVENDTRSRALAEKWFAANRDFDNLLFVQAGDGLSAALLMGGSIWRGASGTAGEIGHMSINPGGEQCYCGGRGCLDPLVTREALFACVRRRLDGKVRSALFSLVQGDMERLSIETIQQALDAADKVAIEAVEEFCAPLGIGLANAINVMNPSHVVIGGPIADLGEHFLAPLCRRIKSQAFPRAAQATDIRISELASRPAALGPAAVVLESRFSAQGTGLTWQGWK